MAHLPTPCYNVDSNGGTLRNIPARRHAGGRIGTVWCDERTGIPTDTRIDGGVVYRPDPYKHPYVLRGLRHTGILDEMLYSDPVIYGAHKQIVDTMAQGSIDADPDVQGADDQTKRIAEYWDWQIERIGVRQLIELAAPYVSLGFVVGEPVLDYASAPGFDAPILAVRRIAPRLPKSISYWLEDAGGQVAGVAQGSKWGQAERVIRADRMVLWSHQQAHHGPEGMPLLRPAYFAWESKRDILLGDASAWERYGQPSVLYNQVAEANFDDEARQKLGEEIEAYEQGGAGLVAPFGFDVSLWSPAHDLADPSARIELLNKELLVISGSLWMISGEHGTRNATGEHVRKYHQSLESHLAYIGERMTSDGEPAGNLLCRLAAYNMDLKGPIVWPRIRAHGIRLKDVDLIVKGLMMLHQVEALPRTAAEARWVLDILDAPPDVISSVPEELAQDMPTTSEESGVSEDQSLKTYADALGVLQRANLLMPDDVVRGHVRNRLGLPAEAASVLDAMRPEARPPSPLKTPGIEDAPAEAAPQEQVDE